MPSLFAMVRLSTRLPSQSQRIPNSEPGKLADWTIQQKLMIELDEIKSPQMKRTRKKPMSASPQKNRKMVKAVMFGAKAHPVIDNARTSAEAAKEFLRPNLEQDQRVNHHSNDKIQI